METVLLSDDGDAPAPDRDRRLAELTTLEVGGPASWLFTALGPSDVLHALRFARERDLPHLLLGGGSNMLVADDGFPGVVIRQADYRLDVAPQPDGSMRVSVGAGVPWDELVAFAVTEGLSGVECLSGIPGTAGAAPIQNIGAYGQEVSETLEAVDVLDVATLEVSRIPAAECGLAYRTSHFKLEWKDRFLVTTVHLRLVPNGPPTVRYPELQRAVGDSPSVAEVRRAVLAIRRRKSMVIDERSPNRRSAGSFFVNPIVPPAQIEDIASTLGQAAEDMPRYAQPGGMVKLSAAWLIEQAGFERGFTLGRAGLSSRHTLALINRGGARADDLLALAALIRRAVNSRFGVTLQPEPVFVGFQDDVDTLLPIPGRTRRNTIDTPTRPLPGTSR